MIYEPQRAMRNAHTRARTPTPQCHTSQGKAPNTDGRGAERGLHGVSAGTRALARALCACAPAPRASRPSPSPAPCAPLSAPRMRAPLNTPHCGHHALRSHSPRTSDGGTGQGASPISKPRRRGMMGIDRWMPARPRGYNSTGCLVPIEPSDHYPNHQPCRHEISRPSCGMRALPIRVGERATQPSCRPVSLGYGQPRALHAIWICLAALARRTHTTDCVQRPARPAVDSANHKSRCLGGAPPSPAL
eukprot:scaffold15732_cov137-Isochrysis_galbana.AAC.1